MPSDELLLCFDDNENPIAPLPRNVVHEKPLKVWHAVTAIYVFNKKKEFLCTKRSEKNEGNPGKWQTHVGGHVKAEQGFAEAALAELREEIGIVVSKDDLVLIDKKKRDDTKHIVSLYVVRFDEPLETLRFTDDEVTAAEWLSFEKYEEVRAQSPGSWCNSFPAELYQQAAALLTEGGSAANIQ